VSVSHIVINKIRDAERSLRGCMLDAEQYRVAVEELTRLGESLRIAAESWQDPGGSGVAAPTPGLDLKGPPPPNLVDTFRDPRVDHPSYYGGADNVYEAIKVIDAWGLGFCLGNAVKYISRAGKKSGTTMREDLKKAAWYVNHEIEQLG
jgi:hypothetical protein